ncbi:replication protein A 70 kDa DNA-binding subunit B-like [Rhododendron vialii]|uniref:replication protein A 70 kDa DNA-binding subunit B-like n=1 Tax=Rhododendron vialii TaxID=182163 RepID=UPI00265F0AFD|nr:replication protein A 70 kDa DNA-binding subunit B-like [Rhododendron vialii]
MIKCENDITMIPVAERVEMHVDAQVPMEEQNREAGPPKDETIKVSHVSEKVGLHDNAQEPNEEINVEFNLPNGEVVQHQGDAKSLIEVSNVHVNCTTGDIMDVPYPYFTDLCQNGYLWRVKARLVRMVEVINPLLPSMTLRLILLDEQGHAMEAIVWPEEVAYFKEHLYEGRVYFLKSVEIMEADEKFKLVSYCYKMSFTDDTRVEHYVFKCDRIPLHWDFSIKLRDIHHFTNKYEQLIDVVGLVVNVTECRIARKRNSRVRDVVLLDPRYSDLFFHNIYSYNLKLIFVFYFKNNMTFVRLSLWNEIATREGTRMLDDLNSNNILFATGLKVKDFDGLYLTTCMKSKLYVNHSFRTDGIPKWLSDNKDTQRLVAWNRTCGFSIPQALIISNAKRVQIKQFVSMPNVQHYRILGRIEKIYEEHIWIYKCKTCFREVENQYGWFVCSQCGEDVETSAKYNVKIVVKDSTGSMELLVKDTKAEFILRCVPSDLKKLMLKENGVQILKKYLEQFYGRAYVFIIPAPQLMYHEYCASVEPSC